MVFYFCHILIIEICIKSWDSQHSLNCISGWFEARKKVKLEPCLRSINSRTFSIVMHTNLHTNRFWRICSVTWALSLQLQHNCAKRGIKQINQSYKKYRNAIVVCLDHSCSPQRRLWSFNSLSYLSSCRLKSARSLNLQNSATPVFFFFF